MSGSSAATANHSSPTIPGGIRHQRTGFGNIARPVSSFFPLFFSSSICCLAVSALITCWISTGTSSLRCSLNSFVYPRSSQCKDILYTGEMKPWVLYTRALVGQQSPYMISLK